METITITITTGTLAFRLDPNREAVRILRCAAELLEQGHEERHLRDAHGNVVGKITIVPALKGG